MQKFLLCNKKMLLIDDDVSNLNEIKQKLTYRCLNLNFLYPVRYVA